MSNSFKTVLIALASIFVSPLNPRKTFEDASVEALADNIKAQGLMQNLVVRPIGDGYEIVASERRYRALSLLVARGDLKENHKVTCQVRTLTDAEALAVALSENEQRENVHPIEQAEGYLRLTREPFLMSAREIAVETGAAESTVAAQLALADNISDAARALYFAKHLDLDQARALCTISKERQEEYLSKFVHKTYNDEDFEHVTSETAEAEGYVLHPDAQPDDEDGYWIPAEGAEPTITVHQIPNSKEIKRHATGGLIPVTRAEFPLELYTKEGGTLMGGMFAETQFFANPELFRRLQRAHLEVLAEQLDEEGLDTFIKEGQPSYKFFGPRSGAVTLYLNASDEVVVKRDFGPELVEKRALDGKRMVDGRIVGNDETSTGKKVVRQNKKRIRLEDRAFNQAAESELMKSFHHALQFFIMTMLGQEGSRLRLEAFMGNPHEGYRNPEMVTRLTAFRMELEAAGTAPEEVGNREGDPLFKFGWNSKKSGLAVAAKLLETKTNEELEQLAHAFIVPTLTPVTDGVFSPAYEYATRFNPDVASFFTPDQAYLQACSRAEIENDIIPALGVGILANTKKEMIADILSRHGDRYAQYVPECMRPGVDAEVIQDPGEAPFDPDEDAELEEELAEAA